MNPLDFITTTNYPSSLLENTFGNQYFKNVVEPTKAAIQSGSQVTKPALGQLIKNWNPLKAFSPTMLKTGPTTGGMVGAGITAGMLGGQLGDWAYKNWEPATKFGDWAGGGIYDFMHGPQMRFKQQQLMNRRKQDMQKRIQQAEAVQQVQQNIQTYGNRDRPNTGMNVPGGGKGQSPTGGDVAGTPFVRGGRVSYFDGGLASLWPR